LLIRTYSFQIENMNIDCPMKTVKRFVNRLFISCLLAGFAFSALSQTQDTIVPLKQDPEKILRNIHLREVTQGGFNLWQDDFIGHFAGVDLGFNTFLNKDYSGYTTNFMENDFFRSNSMLINIIQQSIGVQTNRNTVGLVTGLGLQLQSYRLNRNTTIRLDDNGNVNPKYLLYDQNQKSKFSIASLIVPLLVELQLPVNHYENRYYVSLGPYATYRLSSHTKIKYRVEQKEKLKIPGDYALPDFKYGLMLRTGYRFANVFVTYELVPLFTKSKGPELHPFTVGITLLSF